MAHPDYRIFLSLAIAPITDLPELLAAPLILLAGPVGCGVSPFDCRAGAAAAATGAGAGAGAGDGANDDP